MPVPHPVPVCRGRLRSRGAGADRRHRRPSRGMPHGDRRLRTQASRRMTGTPMVDVRGLTVEFGTGGSPVRAVAGVDVSLAKGEVLALLGESGSGKSVTLRALMRLLPAGRSRIGGTIRVA